MFPYEHKGMSSFVFVPIQKGTDNVDTIEAPDFVDATSSDGV